MLLRAVMISLAALMGLSPLAAVAQKPTKPKPKRPGPAKTTAKTAPKGITGVPQLPGDNGKLNQAYMLGSTDDHLVMVLENAEYSVDRWLVGDDPTLATQVQKLLMLTYTVQNNNNHEMLCRYDTLGFTAVDDRDVNHEGTRIIVKRGETKGTYTASLKPAQKVELVTGIIVPADASIPKLIVQHPADKRVLRYDLRGQVKPLPQPFADPEDKTGCKALANVPGQKGVFYQIENLDIRYDGASWSSERLGDMDLGENNRFLIVTLTFRNTTNTPQRIRYDSAEGELKLSDGEKVARKERALLKTSRNEVADFSQDPGASYVGRMAFEVPNDAKPASLTIWGGESRRIVFDLSDVK